MPELLENVPRWIVELGLVLAVALFAVQFFIKTVPKVAGASAKAKLMACEAKVTALTHELEAQTRLHVQVEKFFHEQIAYYKLDVSDEEIGQVGKIKHLMGRVKEAETQAKKKQNLIQGIFDNCPFTVLVKDKDSRILMVNKPDEEIWGWPIEKIIGSKVRDRFPEIGDIVEANDARVRATMTVSEVTHDNIDAEGNAIKVRAITFPIMENGEYNGVVGTIDVILDNGNIEWKNLLEEQSDHE